MENFLRNPKAESEGAAKTTPEQAVRPEQQDRAERPSSTQPSPEKGTKDSLTISSIYRAHGILMTRDGDKLVPKLKVNGQEVTLGQPFENTKEGLAAADAHLKNLEEQKKADLTKRYGVQFSIEGEDVEKQVLKLNPDQTFERGEMVKARAPSLSELYGVEATLANAQPSHTANDGTAVKFYFLKDKYVKRDDDSTKANFVKTDKDGKPAVYVWPRATDGMPLTEKDLKVQPDSIVEEYSVQSLLTHELGHNTIYRLGWETEKTLVEACKQLGWAPYDDRDSKETIWLIQGKKNDFYKLFDGETWIATNAQGKPVDKDGKVVASEDDAHKLPAEEVRQLALYPPPTDYFDNAVEVAAEALMMLRSSQVRRNLLLSRSPVIYEYIKGKDQEDMDLTHGKTGSGESKMIRIPDGTVVANTAEHRKTIKDFEDAVTSAKKKSDAEKGDAAKP